jgi:hypothetical protein
MQPDDIQTDATVGAEYSVANQPHVTLSAHDTQRVAIDRAQ